MNFHFCFSSLLLHSCLNMQIYPQPVLMTIHLWKTSGRCMTWSLCHDSNFYQHILFYVGFNHPLYSGKKLITLEKKAHEIYRVTEIFSTSLSMNLSYRANSTLNYYFHWKCTLEAPIKLLEHRDHYHVFWHARRNLNRKKIFALVPSFVVGNHLMDGWTCCYCATFVNIQA